jgi:phage protein U
MWTLGTIQFKGLKGFTEFTSEIEANYAEHALIENKPRLQRIGTNLERITLGVLFDVSFCTPEAELGKLIAALEASKPLPLTNGAGTFYGNYVVKRISTTVTRTDDLGRVEACELNVELLEALNPNDAVASRATAFAMAGNNPAVLAFAIDEPFEDSSRMVAYATSVWTDTEYVDELITEANNVPEMEVQNLATATRRIRTIDEATQRVAEIINNTQSSIYNSAADLRGYMSTFQGVVTDLQDACGLGITAAVVANDTMRDAIGLFRRYSSPIVSLKAARR